MIFLCRVFTSCDGNIDVQISMFFWMTFQSQLLSQHRREKWKLAPLWIHNNWPISVSICWGRSCDAVESFRTIWILWRHYFVSCCRCDLVGHVRWTAQERKATEHQWSVLNLEWVGMGGEGIIFLIWLDNRIVITGENQTLEVKVSVYPVKALK